MQVEEGRDDTLKGWVELSTAKLIDFPTILQDCDASNYHVPLSWTGSQVMKVLESCPFHDGILDV